MHSKLKLAPSTFPARIVELGFTAQLPADWISHELPQEDPDGGRLINLTFTSPELLADTVRDAWFALLQSFTLETPAGSRFSAPSV